MARPKRGASSHSRRVWLAIGLALIVVGVAGLDRRIYEASWRLNHPGTPDPADFYHRTIWFWDACRLPGHWIGGIAAYLAIWSLHRRGRRMANIGLLAFLLAGATTYALQHVIGRVRPNQSYSHLTFLGPIAGFAQGAPVCFPSGESTAAFSLATVLAACWPGSRFVFFATATLTATARLVPGSHYLSDVVAGALVGTFFTALTMRWIDRQFDRHECADQVIEA